MTVVPESLTLEQLVVCLRVLLRFDADNLSVFDNTERSEFDDLAGWEVDLGMIQDTTRYLGHRDHLDGESTRNEDTLDVLEPLRVGVLATIGLDDDQGFIEGLLDHWHALFQVSLVAVVEVEVLLEVAEGVRHCFLYLRLLIL